MSDENIEIGNALETDENTEFSPSAKKVSTFSDRLTRVLVFVVIGIIALLVIVTVSMLTFRFMDRGNRTRQFPVLSEDYSTVIPSYDIWTFLADDGYDLRTQTSDVERYTISAKIKLGYSSETYKELQGELMSKNDLLMDTIRFYFSRRTKKQLEDEVMVKTELMGNINSLLSQGEIEQILFLQYQIIGF